MNTLETIKNFIDWLIEIRWLYFKKKLLKVAIY